MKKIIVGLVALVSFASAESYVPVFSTEPIFGTYIPVSELQGTDGIDGESIVGEAGADGVDGVTTLVIVGENLASKLQAVQGAVGSVELDPSHIGLSAGIGYSKSGGQHAGAIGMMYAWQLKTTTVGWNVKAYKAEGSNVKGMSTGLTVGF